MKLEVGCIAGTGFMTLCYVQEWFMNDKDINNSGQWKDGLVKTGHRMINMAMLQCQRAVHKSGVSC